MITRGFIEKVHFIFNELNYHETSLLNYDDFTKSAVWTLTHCKELADAIFTVHMYQFCLKKWSKIEKMLRHKLQTFNEYDFKDKSLISTVSDNDACGTYYITNGIYRNVKKVFIASHSIDDKMYTFSFHGGKFTAFEDGEYYIKYAKTSSKKMKLFDKSDKCLCNIVLCDNNGFYLENNLTPYELVAYDDFIGIYERSYINSLADTDLIDTNRLLADIEWNILEKNSKFGVAKLNVYASDRDLELSKSDDCSTNNDLEMFLFFATSTFLVYQRFIQNQKAIMAFAILNAGT